MSELNAVLDRIEGEMAVLLVGDESIRVVMPARLLPDGVREGDVLKFHIEVDSAATENAKRRVQNLIEKLSEANGERKGGHDR